MFLNDLNGKSAIFHGGGDVLEFSCWAPQCLEFEEVWGETSQGDWEGPGIKVRTPHKKKGYVSRGQTKRDLGLS